jgi:hypothetical protein
MNDDDRRDRCAGLCAGMILGTILWILLLAFYVF